MSATTPPARPHLVILASAGSGKTFALSNRYLKLLRQGAEVDEILAVTFTRKAAGEVLGRVLTRLSKAAIDAPHAAALARDLRDDTLTLADVRAMLQRLCGRLHRVQVSTLDSFFHRLASCFRAELGLPLGGTIGGDQSAAAASVRRAAIAAVLADEPPAVLIDLLRKVQFDQSARSITGTLDTLFKELFEHYRHSDAHAWHTLPAMGGHDRETLDDAARRLRAAAEAPLPDKRMGPAILKAADLAEARQWDAFLAATFPSKVAQRDLTYYGKLIPAEVAATLEELLGHAQGFVLNTIREATAATHALLSAYERQDAALCRAQRLLRFSDLPVVLRRAMAGEGADATFDADAMYYRLDGRLQHLLLDEFQDTSPAQWAILRPLAEQITAGDSDGVGDGDPHKPGRSFFCVGDVKQSIYGWRGGCPEVFDDVIAGLHLDDCRQSLSKSWRSSPVVLRAVDEVFTQLDGIAGKLAADGDTWEQARPACARWAGLYEKHTTQHRDLPGFVELAVSPTPDPGAAVDPAACDLLDDDDDGDDEAGEGRSLDRAARLDAHLRWCAGRIGELRERHRGARIGVLCGRKKTVARLVSLLGAAGVPASGEGGVPLTRDPFVLSITTALLLADHPGDTALGYAVREGPLAETLGLRAATARACDEAAHAVRRELLDRGYAATVARWARALRPAATAANRHRLAQLVALAEAYEPAATLRVRDFVEHVERSEVEQPSAADVRVLTLHKSKGLEFDAVVMPELLQPMGKLSGQALLRYRKQETAAPLAVYYGVKKGVIDALHGASDHVAVIAEARAQELARRLGDDLSTLYVGMTRARQGLHLFLQPPPPPKLNKDGKPGKISSIGTTNRTHGTLLRQAFAPDAPYDKEGRLFGVGDDSWACAKPRDAEPVVDTNGWLDAGPLRSLRRRGASPRRGRAVVSPSSLAHTAVSAGELVLPDRRRSAALAGGSAVHDWLSTIAYADDFDDAVLATLSEEQRAILAKPAVRKALTRREGQRGERLWRERAFAVRDDAGRLLGGRFDRVAIALDADGNAVAAHLVDFKTDAVRDDAALAERVEQYRPQMAAYRAALVTLLKLPASAVTAALLFTHVGVSVAVDA